VGASSAANTSPLLRPIQRPQGAPPGDLDTPTRRVRAPLLQGREVTEAYEGARAKVAAFLGVNTAEIVFTRNVTEAINLLAFTPVALAPRTAGRHCPGDRAAAWYPAAWWPGKPPYSPDNDTPARLRAAWCCLTRGQPASLLPSDFSVVDVSEVEGHDGTRGDSSPGGAASHMHCTQTTWCSSETPTMNVAAAAGPESTPYSSSGASLEHIDQVHPTRWMRQ
jgi:hypothetical protein